jgi:DNA-binding MarR family transcriptional regulator
MIIDGKLIKYHMVSKRIIISFVVGFAVYMTVAMILATLFQPTTTVLGGRFAMMGSAAPGTTQNNDYIFYLMMTSVMGLIAGTAAGAITYHFYPEEKEPIDEEETEYVIDDVVWGILNENEKKVMKEVVRSEGVTQDSLVHRLGYSKAKLSILLNDLEKKDLVMREKLGRTNSIILTERMKKVLSKNGE